MNTHVNISSEHRLDEILHDASAAMQEMHLMIKDIEHVFMQNAVDIASTHTSRKSLQSIDLLDQMVREMALLCKRLQNQVPKSIAISHAAVIAPIRIEQLRQHFEKSDTSQNAENTLPKDIALF